MHLADRDRWGQCRVPKQLWFVLACDVVTGKSPCRVGLCPCARDTA